MVICVMGVGYMCYEDSEDGYMCYGDWLYVAICVMGVGYMCNGSWLYVLRGLRGWLYVLW